MKKIKVLLIFVLLLILVGCSNREDTGIVQIDYATFEQLADGQLNGFVIPVNDYEKINIDYIEDALEKSNDAKIYLYNTLQPNGKDGETEKRETYGYGSKMKKNDLYYISNGKVQDVINLDGYSGTELTMQIEHLIEVHSK